MAKAAVSDCLSISALGENLIAVSSRVAVMGLNPFQRRGYASTIARSTHLLSNRVVAFVWAWSSDGTAVVWQLCLQVLS